MSLSLEKLWDEAGFTPNTSQREAITHIDGPLFLPAGPGSGKTRVLLWRTVNLIAFHNVKPEEIILATFTEKAAFQLKQGLQSLLGRVTNHTGVPYDLSPMLIGTVHSICQRLITERKFSPNQTRPVRPIVMDRMAQYFYVRRFLNDGLQNIGSDYQSINLILGTNSEYRSPAIDNAIRLFGRFTEEHLDIEACITRANDTLKPGLQLYDLYRQSLIDGAGVKSDLSLLQTAAFDLLNSNPAATQAFKYVIVDEYQDTNAIQEVLYFKFAEHSQNLCVVGDDDQALYRFRGATVENFVEFPRRCRERFGREPKKIPLDINYRSRKQIVDFYTQFMDQEDWSRNGGGQYRVEDKNIRAASEDGGVSVALTSNSALGDVCAEVATLAKKLLDEGKVQDPNQIAVLSFSLGYQGVPSANVVALMDAFEEVGLKSYAPRAGRFLDVEEAVSMFGLIAEVLQPPYADNPQGAFAKYHGWLRTCRSRASELMRADHQLAEFVQDRRREAEGVARDFELLLQTAHKEGWDISQDYDLNVMKPLLAQTPGISEKARKSLTNAFMSRITLERIQEGRPFKLSYILNAACSLDWNVLDLFYRLTGFDHFKRMFDVAETGEDEGPVCNLSLITKYLSFYLQQYPSVITGRALVEDDGINLFQQGFYSSFLYYLYKSGEGEEENADDPFPRGRIPFLTIHQSKGLEFPVVILLSPFRQNRQQKMEEVIREITEKDGEPLDRLGRFDIMRTFYVALSRAENLMIVGNVKGGKVDPAFKTMFQEAGLLRVPDLDVASIPTADINTSQIPKNYSFTSDFQLYTRCPRQYMLFRKYGFVPSRSQTMFFGSLVHSTLEDLHHLLIRKREVSAR